jgi:Type I phosphodiesterase / nucleotide pyrophosphatase
MVPEPDKRVDELRQQLRSLGYLDAGVDRFVLAAASDSGRPVGLAARASVRVGLLGGLLLGPAAALGLGARLPGLVTGVRDAFVLAVYLAILFLIAVTATSFLLAVVLRRMPRVAGWIFTIACLLYLTLWWQNANAGFGWNAPGWTAFALVVAVAISLLLGHAVRIATLGVLAAGGRSGTLPPVASRSWRVIVGGGLLAFGGAAALLIATATSEARATAPQRLTVTNSRAPIWLIALDGFDPATYARLESSLPNLRAALTGRQFPLQPQDTSDPARAWTTIATGVPPDVHGVHAIETRRVAGLRGAIAGDARFGRLIGAASDLVRLTQPSTVSSEQRQAKTIWEVAEDAGLRTTVINWWATWPAPSNAGIVVSDRAVLRLEHGGALDAEIEPPSVYDSLSREWPTIRARAREAAATAFPDRNDPQTAAVLRRSAELDASIAAIAQSLASGPLDLFVVYLPGLDIAQNALLGPSAGAVSTSAMAARVDALRSYYPFLDGVVGPLVRWREYHTMMIVTQPGRVQTSTGGLFVQAYSTANAETPGRNRSPLDVAPTVWATLGLPLSRELAGQPIGLIEPSSYRYVDRYGKPFAGTAPRTGKPLDQETIDRLRSLGYIK